MKSEFPNRRTRIKICGITRVEDALAAAAIGVDAVGVVLTEKSKRFAGIARACEIRRVLPPFVDFIALFMDDLPGFIAEAVAAVQPDMLQFHGRESAQDCVRYGMPYLKAIAMGGGMEMESTVRAHPTAAGFVLDGHAAGERGGSGRTFDWSTVAGSRTEHLVLAGGLTSGNVGAAIRAALPYAVDVSSSVESMPGIKIASAMADFVAAVRAADVARAQA